MNFDDFEIPGLTDKKAADMPDKEKQIANVAFEKFKEFFKDPKKSAKSYEPPKTSPGDTSQQTGSELKSGRTPPNNKNNNPPRQFHQRVRPNPESLQQHYPVQLTQPLNQNPTTSRAPISNPAQQRNPSRAQNPNQHQQHLIQNENLNNHRLHYNPPPQLQENNNNPQLQSAPQHPLRHSSHAIAFTNNNQPSRHQNQEFNANKLPPTTHNPVNQPQSQLPPQEPSQEYRTIPQDHRVHKTFPPHPNQLNGPEGGKVNPHPSQNSLPPGNFQRFTIYSHNKSIPTSQRPSSTTPRQQQEVGKVVRNQLLFNHNNQNSYQEDTQRPQNTQRPHHQQQQQQQQQLHHASPIDLVPPQEADQEYRTITQTQYPQPPPPSFQNPSSSSSSSVPSLQPFPSPQDPQQTPVSHIFIQHENHEGSSPVHQTSFHPRFRPPTKFANDFTPSVNHITTPLPHFDVTPSMPMILISTNENAITDPKRMELLRQQQRTMEEKRQKLRQQQQEQNPLKDRQPHSLSYAKQGIGTQAPHYINTNQITEDPQKQNLQTYSSQNAYTQQQYRQYSNSNNNNGNTNHHQHQQNHHHQNEQQTSFNFQAQQQQHQLHNLQNLYYNTQVHPQSSPQLPPRPYYEQQQQQPQAQPSTNYASVPISNIQPPPPLVPRFQVRPGELQHPFYATRHKRGYRHRLSSILRGLWGDGDYK